MSRPSSGKESRSRRALQSPKNGDVISYEDLLVAQYLEELRKSPPYTKPTSQSSGSPYLQKLAHTHVVPTVSAGTRSLSASSNKPKIDPKFIADPNLWDPATPRVIESGRPNSKYRRRPISAPAYKRPYSALYGASRPSSAKSSVFGGKKVKSLYKRQPWTIVVTAFKNGDRSIFTRVAAPTIKAVLEYCTEKLFLSTAARRMFLPDGTEVFTAADIPRDAEVFISCGENFKDPHKPVKKHNEMSKSATWTMNGLVWSADTKHKHTKPKLSKRFRNLIEKNRRRVLVFKNGQGSQGVEIVADPERFEDFLVACTAKLDLGSYSRVLYDWEGQQVNSLFDAPVLDQCLQTWTTPVLGPLWVSKGEGFSPKGVSEFLDGLISYTRTKLKEAKQYRKQLQLSQDEATREQVDVVAILSMSTKETDDALDIVARDIEDFSNALNHLKDQKDRIEDNVADERETGYEYTLKHIEKLESGHRMVGAKGIRLKVYENGTYDDYTTIYFNVQQAVRGLGHDQKQLMARLLDQCCSCGGLANPKHSPAIRSVAKKIYNNLGQEINNVYDLESEQEIWLSFGENWKNPFTYVLGVLFDKVLVFDMDSTKRGVRGQLMLEDIVGRDRSSCWEVVHGVPEDVSVKEVNATSSPEERDTVLGLLDSGEVDVNRQDFLQAKDSSDMLVFGDVVVDAKKQKGNKDMWPADSQTWLISKNGYIYCRSMPQLVLGVSDQRVATNLGHPYLGQTDVKVEGYAVSLQKKEASPAQQWWFSTEGQIGSQLHTELFLTYLGSQYNNDASQLINEAEGSSSGDRLCLAVCQKVEGKNNRSQRWAIKQERLDILGQWKMTKVDNPEWHKRALSWPVDQQGALNSEYEWPMEGFLLPYAPTLTASTVDKRSPPGAVPIRLMVLRNGERDLNKVTAVVGPDLTNMKKDTDKKNKRSMVNADTDSIDMDTPLHCDAEITVLKLEFTMFLERVTSLLNLPFAARRLFDSQGKEHFDMRGLKRDELVYASCGEHWSDPNLSKAEQQRRHLLANLAGDVAKIKQFVALRNPQDLVLEVESLSAGSAVQVARSALSDREEKPPRKSTMERRTEEVDKDETEESDLFSGTMTAHEISHQRAELRHDSRKFPWERDAGDGDDQEVDEEEKQFTNPELYRRFKQKSHKRVDLALQQQKFVMEDGYIATAANRDLVLGLDPGDQESRITPIVLVKRSREDIYQRWTLTDNGIIQAKYNPQLVLTVTTPGNEEQTASVSLQSKKTSQFGRANQRWHHDQSTGFLHAFHTDSMDKEITAANKANVCTFAVMGGTEVDQPGYLVKMTGERGAKSKSLLVCASCARAMRGRYKLERISGNVDFACSMGNAKDLGIRQIGSFQCLNGKVDLSTHEADHTLEEWQGQLDDLHNELSVRSIARQISAARTPYTVKVLTYKNGEGRMKPGELLVASSVAGILEQATERLELGRAARRLYTSDGQLILDVDDLVTWVKDEYVRDAQRQIRQKARAKRQLTAEDDTRENLMDKVELDSDESSEEDEEEEEPQEAPPPSHTVIIEEDSFQQGYAAQTPRSIIDPASWSGVIMIPNSTQEVGQDGMLTRWQLYTTGAGQTKLMVMRPDPDNLNSYQVVGMSLCQAPGAGCQTLNLQADHQIPVIKGDVIAFHFVNNPLIPYEIDQDSNEPPLYKKVVGEAPELGAMLKMNMYKQTGCRKYAVNATITVRREVLQETPPPPPRPISRKKRTDSKKKKKRPLPYVEPPPLDLVLRYPIEVWASCGEAFIKPQRVEASHEASQEQREARASVSYELDKEKHVLRHMQGRRYEGQEPGHYRATRNPQRPVLIAGHWQEATLDELAKHDIVHQLETHLHELKRSQRPASMKSSTITSVQRLYTQPSMKRVLVFPNGESVERAVYVWADNMPQMLDNCTARLNLRKPAKHLFNMNGYLLQDFSEVERDQLLCVSPNKTFLQPRESQQLIEVKANWGRARKQYGPQATDIVVAADRNPQVDVDAFAPSSLAGGSQNKNTTQSSSDC